MKDVILNTSTGSPIPRTENMGIEPLKYEGRVVKNMKGNVVYNDQWIYVNTTAGRRAINVWRSKYCEKVYLSNVKIIDSIGKRAKLSKDLKLFIDKVADTLAFKKFGKWYRIFLRQEGNTFYIARVALYKWVYEPNRKIDGLWAYELAVDWRQKFYVR